MNEKMTVRYKKVYRMNMEYVSALQDLGLTREEVGKELLMGGIVFLKLADSESKLSENFEFKDLVNLLKDAIRKL